MWPELIIAGWAWLLRLFLQWAPEEQVSFITDMLMQVLDHASENADEHVTLGELIDLKSL